MTKYVLETGFQMKAKDFDLSIPDVLRYAKLPQDLFLKSPVTITGEEYLKLWGGIEYVMRDDPAFPLKIGQSVSAESFSPTLFSCLSSQNLTIALERIKKYKPLVGPLRFELEKSKDSVSFALRDEEGGDNLPWSLLAGELVFWTQIGRMSTREHIVPLTVHFMHDLPEQSQYEAYFGTQVTRSSFNGLTFSLEDAERPFLSANAQMWSIFEPALNKRLQDLNQESSFSERVRASLMEILASGQYSMSDVASKLAISNRTLQRRLAAENTTFQKELEQIREELAFHYLSTSDYTNNQIAFLLGYEEATSFYRAFRNWTGQTPEQVRMGTGAFNEN
ncbi:MAG: AraC family transcriptional regulator ligand-binding domain-containing protein [Chloroflexota bacterium]